MNIGIVGTGYVGLTTGLLLAEIGSHNVWLCDIDQDKIEQLNNGKMPFYEPMLGYYLRKNTRRAKFTTDIKTVVENSNIIFLCVGTPSNPDGSPNMKYMIKATEQIAEYMNGPKIIVIKSTVPVFAHAQIYDIIHSKNDYIVSVVNNPEFLREGSAVYDTEHAERIIIGADNDYAKNEMKELYKDFKSPIYFMDNTTAEIIKYAANAFLATKISYINMMSQIAEASGADVQDIALGIGTDSRIGVDFLKAGIGYGGSCFGKDISALINYCDQIHVDCSMLKSTASINENQVDYFIRKMEIVLGNLKNKKIGVLGLSFKPNTDDLRDSPSIKIIEKLLEKGAKIKAHDIASGKKVQELYPKIQIIDAETTDKKMKQIAKNADALVILTEWGVYYHLEWDKLQKLMKTPIIFDGRNMLEKPRMIELGFEYYGIGR